MNTDTAANPSEKTTLLAGDIVVLLYPEDPSKSYIKRVVGLPGEQIEIEDGKLFINGAQMDESYLDPGYLSAGLYDYWRWGYDYGHNLDARTAIIKIPGMTYQPPLIGSKQLLNFTATSWPASGGWALVIASGLVAFAVWQSSKRSGRAAAPLAA